MYRTQWTDEKLFSRLVNNKSKKTYWDNIIILRQRPNENIFNLAKSLLISKDANSRIVGIDVLAQLGNSPRPFYKETIKLFFDLLKIEIDPKVLKSLLFAIGHNNDNLSKNQIKKLSDLKSTENILIKEGLVFSLLGVNDKNAIETLIKLSKDSTYFIRDWATFGLGTQIEEDNEDIRNALFARVYDKHQETKLEAIAGLAIRKDERIKSLIIQELVNGEFSIVLLEAIEEIGDKEMLKTIEKYYKEEKNKKIPKEWLDDLKQTIKNLEKKIKNVA